MRRSSRTRTALAGLFMIALLAAGCGGDDDENMFAPVLAKFRHRVHGTVSHYDASAKTFAVTDRHGHQFTFSLDDQTRVTGTVADGAAATVRYHRNGTVWHANIVKVFPAPAAQTAAVPAPAPAAAPATPKKP